MPGQINQLFFNLFSNALKFSRPDIQVKIKIEGFYPSKEELSGKGLDVDRRYVKISFSDNGIGFKQENAENIFGLFKRLHRKTEYEGTRIGLGLCKKIVQNHNGAIWAESEKDKGSTFQMILPG
ncbi:MAG: sensor histidine kinase [Segetibacter sp.]